LAAFLAWSRSAPATATSATKERFENVSKGAKAAKVLPTAVVLGALLGIRQDVVGVGDELELLFSIGILVDIGV
jgi:hypothetical protein